MKLLFGIKCQCLQYLEVNLVQEEKPEEEENEQMGGARRDKHWSKTNSRRELLDIDMHTRM